MENRLRKQVIIVNFMHLPANNQISSKHNDMTTHNITHFPFVIPAPQHMKPLEQVMCMVYLAQTYSLEELRERQNIIEQQIQSANIHRLPTKDLLAMQENLCAAVAYQTYPDDTVWMSFIQHT